MRVFIDTNVLLDVLAHRAPFYDKSASVWLLAESGRLEGLVSAISFSNCWYLVRKHSGRVQADKALRLLRDTFTPIALSEKILMQAIDAGFSDFEDAIQFHSARAAGAERIITRDQDHFPRTPLPVLSPGEFLNSSSLE